MCTAPLLLLMFVRIQNLILENLEFLSFLTKFFDLPLLEKVRWFRLYSVPIRWSWFAYTQYKRNGRISLINGQLKNILTNFNMYAYLANKNLKIKIPPTKISRFCTFTVTESPRDPHPSRIRDHIVSPKKRLMHSSGYFLFSSSLAFFFFVFLFSYNFPLLSWILILSALSMSHSLAPRWVDWFRISLCLYYTTLEP